MNCKLQRNKSDRRVLAAFLPVKYDTTYAKANVPKILSLYSRSLCEHLSRRRPSGSVKGQAFAFKVSWFTAP